MECGYCLSNSAITNDCDWYQVKNHLSYVNFYVFHTPEKHGWNGMKGLISFRLRATSYLSYVVLWYGSCKYINQMKNQSIRSLFNYVLCICKLSTLCIKLMLFMPYE